MTKYTQQELVDELTRRFGPDQATWSWTCAACGDVASIGEFRAALEDRPRTHPGSGTPVRGEDIAGQECIGRSLGALDLDEQTWVRKRAAGEVRGCVWVAYGLFAGPSVMVLPDGREIRMFNLAEPTQAPV